LGEEAAEDIGMVNKKSLENLKNGKKFGPSNPSCGRKKSRLKDFMIKKEISLSDVKKIFQGLILTHSVDELTKMVQEDKDLPIIVTMCISAFLHDTKRGGLASMHTVLDRVYGKPVQTDVIEVHEMSEETKRRMMSIYNDVCRENEQTGKVKPKNIMPQQAPKPKDD
jgi:hypothetical protein